MSSARRTPGLHRRVASLLVVLTSTAALGATIEVPADQPTIQAAVDAAGPGDHILVAPGDYQESVRIVEDRLPSPPTCRRTRPRIRATRVSSS
jgi:hypothetical protein